MLPENLNIPPPRPKRKPAHPYPRKAEPQTSEQLLPAQSGSGSLPTLAAAAAAASPSQQQQQAAGAAQARGVSPGPRHAAGSEAGGVSRPSPFSAVQQQVHSRRQLPGASSGGSAGADRQQHGQAEGGGHAAAVAAVAAAASAAAAAAAAAVVAAAEAHVQASLQANPPKGFPFFGLPPSILANMGLQGQASGAIGSLSLAPSLLLSPAPSAGGIHPAQHIPDSSALQGLSQGFAQTAQLPLNVAALSTLARLACSGGLAGLTAAVGGGAVTTCPEAQQAVAVHAVAGDGHTATNVPGARNPAAVQAADDASDGLRRDSGKRNSSDGDSACSREHATDCRTLQGAVAAPSAAINAAAAVANEVVATDPFAAYRLAQGLAAANNAAAQAGWAAAAGGLPIAALLTAGAGAASSGGNGATAMPGPFALPLVNGGLHPAAAWTGYGTSLLNAGETLTAFARSAPRKRAISTMLCILNTRAHDAW